MNTLKLSSIQKGLMEWFYATIFPTLPWYLQFGASLTRDGMMKAFMDKIHPYYDFLKLSGVFAEDGTVNTQSLENGLVDLFKHTSHLNVEFLGQHLKVTKQNCAEILASAKRIESQEQVAGS